MAETFEVGSIVACMTCFKEDLEGEVIAYDPHVNVIALKSPAASGRPTVFDVQLVNLKFASRISVVKDAPSNSLSLLPSLNLNKLNSRAKQLSEEKRRLLHALQTGGTIEGQKLFIHIGKTIDEITWSGPNILVFNEVTISPPYLTENVKDNNGINSRAVILVRKMVDKFHKDQQTLNGSNLQTSCNNSAMGGNVAATEMQPVVSQ